VKVALVGLWKRFDRGAGRRLARASAIVEAQLGAGDDLQDAIFEAARAFDVAAAAISQQIQVSQTYREQTSRLASRRQTGRSASAKAAAS
jgi:hypothetical protein